MVCYFWLCVFLLIQSCSQECFVQRSSTGVNDRRPASANVLVLPNRVPDTLHGALGDVAPLTEFPGWALFDAHACNVHVPLQMEA